MKFTVFGGGGFIGSAIVDRLLAEGHAIRVFERPRVAPYREFAAGERVEWETGDLLSAHDVAQAIAGSDAVIHLVSTTLPKSSNDDPAYDVSTNVIATLSLLDAMVEQGIKRIIYISSGGTVYGTPQYVPIDEKHPTDPEVSYGITKLTIEKYLQLYQRLHGLRATILRVANPYGERQRVETAQGAVGVFLHRVLSGQGIEIWGDGSVMRDFIYVGDVADAFVRATKYEGKTTVFNIGSGVGTSLNELVRAIGEVTGATPTCNYLPGRAIDVPVSVLDCSLAMRELGWSPQVSLPDGLARTVRWLQGQSPKARD
jgi:UDP-glucose 4-epimerase